MWPFKSSNTKAATEPKVAPARREFEHRYAEHLASLAPEKVKLLQVDPPVSDNVRLMMDLLQTTKEFQREMADHREIETVQPGVSRDQAFISVFVHAAVDVDACRLRLPEFFRGYVVRVHGRAKS
jgi:hypothetical protein